MVSVLQQVVLAVLAVLAVLVALAVPSVSAYTWCYGKSWCEVEPHRLHRLDVANASTWPQRVRAIAFHVGNSSVDELRRHYFRGDETRKQRAEMEHALQDILDDPYPITVRQNPEFKVGHNQPLFDYRDEVVISKNKPKPGFVEPSVDVDLLEGSNLNLSCKIVNRAGNALIWRKGDVVLAINAQPSAPGRFHSDDQGNLYIKKADLKDSGEYYCSLGTIGPFQQRYVVDVLAPTHIVDAPGVPGVPGVPGTVLELASNGEHTLVCNVTGEPRPIVRWLKQGVPGVLSEGQTYTIGDASRDDTGVYICVAYNGVGSRLVRTFRVTVQYPPELNCSDHSHVKDVYAPRDVVIACEVDAYPRVTAVTMTAPGFLSENLIVRRTHLDVVKAGRYEVVTNNDLTRVQFVVRAFTPTDLGAYRIFVQNAVGTDVEFHQLTDTVRHPIRVSVRRLSDDSADVNVSFHYVSNLPPSRLMFLYRARESEEPVPYTLMYDKKGLVVPPDFARSGPGGRSGLPARDKQVAMAGLNGWAEVLEDGPTPPLSFELRQLRDLEADSFYDGVVQIGNAKGWHWNATVFHFHTLNRMGSMAATTNDSVVEDLTSTGTQRRAASSLVVVVLLTILLYAVP